MQPRYPGDLIVSGSEQTGLVSPACGSTEDKRAIPYPGAN